MGVRAWDALRIAVGVSIVSNKDVYMRMNVEIGSYTAAERRYPPNMYCRVPICSSYGLSSVKSTIVSRKAGD